MDLEYLSEIAIKAAISAGQVIIHHMNEDVQVEQKAGGESYASQVVTHVDRACEETILSYLLPSCKEFDIAILTEESEDDGSRFKKDYFWCVDPMDGTLPFIKKEAGFSVAIALVAKDGTPCIGVVYDPCTQVHYHAVKGKGAFKNGTPWKAVRNNDYLTYVTDRRLADTPAAEEIKQLLDDLQREQHLQGIKELSGGGSVMNAIRVLELGPACMMKLPKKENGGGSLWDYASTACIYSEMGLPATNWRRGKLDLNRVDSSFMNHEGIYFANFEMNKPTRKEG